MNGYHGVREKIQYEQTRDAAIPVSASWQTAGSRNDKGLPRIAQVASGAIDKIRCGIAADDGRGFGEATCIALALKTLYGMKLSA